MSYADTIEVFQALCDHTGMPCPYLTHEASERAREDHAKTQKEAEQHDQPFAQQEQQRSDESQKGQAKQQQMQTLHQPQSGHNPQQSAQLQLRQSELQKWAYLQQQQKQQQQQETQDLRLVSDQERQQRRIQSHRLAARSGVPGQVGRFVQQPWNFAQQGSPVPHPNSAPHVAALVRAITSRQWEPFRIFL
jgi:hypothetical protein